jgi:hypothetical protein
MNFDQVIKIYYLSDTFNKTSDSTHKYLYILCHLTKFLAKFMVAKSYSEELKGKAHAIKPFLIHNKLT